ncbi:MAG: DUF192 domain-containing protein [Betaproteobacteria bacterium]
MVVMADDGVSGGTGESAAFSTFRTGQPVEERDNPGARSRVTVLNMTRSTVLATRAQLALSAATRARGLLGRTSLEEGEGLVIRPCKGVHSFGMKFAIDVAYVDRAGVVVCVLAPLLPGKAGPMMREASWVVELPEGALARTGTVIGDRLQVFYCK